jgi:hypothetical protein
MKLTFGIVPNGQQTIWVSKLLPYLKKSEIWSRGRCNVDDIVRFVVTGQLLLWAVYNPENQQAFGFVITETKEYPRGKMLVLQYCAGEPGAMALVDDEMQASFEDFARKAGCMGIEFYGRLGWRNQTKKYGYTSKSVVYEKFFGPEKT